VPRRGGRVWPDDHWQAEELVLEAAVKANEVRPLHHPLYWHGAASATSSCQHGTAVVMLCFRTTCL